MESHGVKAGAEITGLLVMKDKAARAVFQHDRQFLPGQDRCEQSRQARLLVPAQSDRLCLQAVLQQSCCQRKIANPFSDESPPKPQAGPAQVMEDIAAGIIQRLRLSRSPEVDDGDPGARTQCFREQLRSEEIIFPGSSRDQEIML